MKYLDMVFQESEGIMMNSDIIEGVRFVLNDTVLDNVMNHRDYAFNLQFLH
jgi:hypothetical protein